MGDTTQRNIPTIIPTASTSIANKTIVAIAGGAYHTLALDSTGQLHAWGNNGNGQLGMGASDTTQRNIPTIIPTASTSIANKTIVAIACGYYHTLALDSTGQLHAWGNNVYGQLGMGASDVTQRNIPTIIPTASTSIANKTIVAIACGSNHTLALDSTGQLHAWGYNASGQLLTNNTAQYNIPTITTVTLWSSATSTVGGSTPLLLNFTGQHRCFLDIDGQEGQSQDTINQLEGLIVVSDKGRYVNPELTIKSHGPSTPNDALPIVSLCSVAKDKRVFGVISAKVDLGVNLVDGHLQPISNSGDMAIIEEQGDVRAQINAIGDGALWVIESVDPLQAGDLITTSATRGYGQAQDDDCMRASTVAKITMDCNFAPAQVAIEEVQTVNGNAVLDTNQAPVWITLGQTDAEYKLRYVNVADGSIATLDEYTASATASNGLVKRAALLGCTYHSG
jgi:hypothetical protein